MVVGGVQSANRWFPRHLLECASRFTESLSILLRLPLSCIPIVAHPRLDRQPRRKSVIRLASLYFY
jgi:hypothetical protein